jgi:hypothetical protein
VGDVISGSQAEHEMMGQLFLILKLLFCWPKGLEKKKELWKRQELLKRVVSRIPLVSLTF